MLSECHKEAVVVGGADAEVGVPVGRSPAIVRSLRVAHRDAFVGRDGRPPGVIADAPSAASVSVQHKHERCPRREVGWEVEVVGALDTAVFEGLFGLGVGVATEA